jgi:hypothetical protein
MKFEREHVRTIDPVSEKQLLQGLRHMRRATSRSRMAILTSETGSYVQVGGAGLCCALEWRDALSGRHFRASQDPPVVPWPGVTAHQISGGFVSLRQEEFFRITQAEEAFMAFYDGKPFPAYIRWRDITEELGSSNV